jgi:hypothetical protein
VTELKPCLFCGGEAKWKIHYTRPTCSTCQWWEPIPSFWPLDWGLSSKCKRLTNRDMDEPGEAQIEWCSADFGCNKWEGKTINQERREDEHRETEGLGKEEGSGT